MSDRPRIDLFCEDRAHEELLKHLVLRLCSEEGLVGARIDVRSARGGHGKATGWQGERVTGRPANRRDYAQAGACGQGDHIEAGVVQGRLKQQAGARAT